MNKVSTFWGKHPKVRNFAWAFIGFNVAGLMLSNQPTEVTKEVVRTVEVPKEVVKTVEVNKTPQSCIDLFQLDNQMFVRVGQAISSGDPTEYTATTVYIKGVTDKRMLLADSCIAGRYN